MRTIQRDIIINVPQSSRKVAYPLFLPDFNDKIFKYQTQLKKLSSGSRSVPCGPADGGTNRHDEANSLFFFCKFLNAPKRELFTKSRIMAVFTFTPTAH
jgi:hypothetical protein